MGQRLNIELLNNGKLLANCYWHWKGYTSTAVELTDRIIIENQLMEAEPTVETAIRIFQSLGAGVIDTDFASAKSLIGEDAVEGTDRNLGVIAIETDSMELIEGWEEARVQIDLSTKRINFGALWEPDEDEYSVYTVVRIPYDVHDMSFATFYDFCHDLAFDKRTEFVLLLKDNNGKHYTTI